ncbi:MAG: thiopurine S-methyltransferase [Methylophilales bacterium]|nr:thiopurine S-methyltransferase [Methylophilales bacterium]
MNPDFWLSKWQKGETGFHSSEPHPYLTEFWSQMPACQRVLVPLCGKSLDMCWLRDQGLAVLGVELSELAVKDFFRSANLEPEKSQKGILQSWKADGIEILCGDFFALTATDLGGCDVIYDRAALIALPTELRLRYVQTIKRLFPQGTLILLVTLEYPQAEMTGPPFSVSEDEVRELYARSMIETLTRRDVLQDNERFHQRGISKLFENAYLITL